MVRLEIAIDDGSSDRTESIDCTGGHPFWVVSGDQLDERPACTELPIHDSQMTPSGRWTEARWLRLGDRFLTRTGASATVSGLTIRTERVQVYNLHVKDLQLYAVGESGLLVHNNSAAMTPSQRALKELVEEATHGGRKPLSVDDAETVLDWATEVGLRRRAIPGDVATPSNWTSNPVPHIHLEGCGRGGHVPVMPGVKPR